jgi:hypothetical protein
MIKQVQHSEAVTSGQGDALVPRNDLSGGGQGSTQHKAGKIQAFVCGCCSENALLSSRSAERYDRRVSLNL